MNGGTRDAIEWVRDSGAKVNVTLAAWSGGQLAELPVGQAWDVVRVPHLQGADALQQLRVTRAPFGPILYSPAGFEFLLRVGSAADWDLPGATAITHGEVLLVPHPSVISPAEPGEWHWIVPPDDGGSLTDASDLYGAYASAVAFFHLGAS
ncbi:hypothetical protein [Streptomyces sp. NPDC051561]|uniref:hypothetical protein n=1 Tax=Streptomyces sp. NPDC051561 TaxID=3365658 RepID=UPI0037A75B7D